MLNVAKSSGEYILVVNCVVEYDLQRVTKCIAKLDHIKTFNDNADTCRCFMLKFTDEVHKIEVEVSRRKGTNDSHIIIMRESRINQFYWWSSMWWSKLPEFVALELYLASHCINSACNSNYRFDNCDLVIYR